MLSLPWISRTRPSSRPAFPRPRRRSSCSAHMPMRNSVAGRFPTRFMPIRPKRGVAMLCCRPVRAIWHEVWLRRALGLRARNRWRHRARLGSSGAPQCSHICSSTSNATARQKDRRTTNSMSALPLGQSRPVLILGASARISIPIARSLQKCGVAVDVAHLSKTDPKFRSRAVRECILLPDFREHPAEMLDSLTSLIRSRGYDTLIPVQDGAAQIVAENYSVLSSLLRVASPPPHVLRRVLDKDATLRVARQCGIPIPRSYTVATPAELGAVASELTFPVVMKPSVHNGQPSFKVRYFEHIDHLKMALTENRCGPVLLQEYCAGEGVGVEMLIHQGACLATFQHRRLKEGPASGGVAVMAISEEPDP